MLVAGRESRWAKGKSGKIVASDGRLLVVDGEVNKPCSLVELATGKERGKVGSLRRPILFSPDGRFLVGLIDGPRVQVVETKTNKVMNFFPYDLSTSVRLTPASFAVTKPWLVVPGAGARSRYGT